MISKKHTRPRKKHEEEEEQETFSIQAALLFFCPNHWRSAASKSDLISFSLLLSAVVVVAIASLRLRTLPLTRPVIPPPP
jgi:hypothetical protein